MTATTRRISRTLGVMRGPYRRTARRRWEPPVHSSLSPGMVNMQMGTLQGVSPSAWRWRWDLNPRWSYPHTRFRGVLLRPLGHATGRDDTRPKSGEKFARNSNGLLPGALSLLFKEGLQLLGTLNFLHAGNYFRSMIKTTITQDVEERACRACLRIPRTKDHSTNTS